MFKSGTVFLFLLVMLSCVFSSAHAQLPQMQAGLSYLTSSQHVDGAWDSGTSSTETTAATVSVIETLKLLNQTASAPYNAAVSWLQAQSPDSVAYIAERSSALGLAGSSIGDLLTVLDAVKGAWGGYQGYETDVLDTALALKALKSADYTDQTTLNQALAYLTNSQNLDGGWGFRAGGPSDLFVTSIVSAALQQYPQMTTIANGVGKARTYLLASQNPDGSFGNPTVFETALAYIALVGDLQTPAVSLQNSVNFLVSAQSVNGSWNDDPYATALALKALHYSENRPSPPPPPPAGGIITGTVIDAVTKAPVGGVSIVLDSNSLINTTSDSSGNFTLSDVPAGNQSVKLSLSGYTAKTASTSVAVSSVADIGNVELLSSYSTGTIAGIITDTAGKPISDAAVTVSGTWSGTALTGADGSYSFSHVIPGDVTLTAAKAGYHSITGIGTVFARTTLTFSPRLSTTPPQGSTGTLIGRVVDNYWGVPIGHLPGEEGVTVRVSGCITVEPDDGGYFTIPGLAPNTYQVTVGMNGFASQTFRLVIVAGSSADLGTIRLLMSVTEMTLTGKITDATTGAPIPGAEVAIQGSNLAGRADFAGSYGIADIKLGSEYPVKVSADGYIGKSFTVSPAPWRRTMDFSLMPYVTKGTLTGTVIDASTNLPLAGVTLALVEDPSIGATTNADGVFNINNVKQGAQKVNLILAGYSSRVMTTTVIPGAVNNVGRIALSVSPLAASVQGLVWEAVTNLPFAGVTMHAGTGVSQATTGADGTYRIDAVEPGEVTVATGVVPKANYSSARFTGTVEPGGVLVFNTVLSTTIPVTLDVSVQTDKNIYKPGETVGVAFHLQNRQAAPVAAQMHVQVLDPAGIKVFEKSFGVDLVADGTSDLSLSYALPLSAQSGTYSIVAETFGVSGSLLHRAVKTFGVAISQVEVTPTLPALFLTGANNVTFDLANSGAIAVSQGRLNVTLTDPDGEIVSTSFLPFALDLGQTANLSLPVVLPALKFGSYTLSFAQSDETKNGVATTIALPNTLAVTALYDDASHRVRNTANLSVLVSNTGRFNFDSATGAAVNVSVPDAAFTATKTLLPVPAVGRTSQSALLFNFAIPDTLTAGQHGTRVTITLPSGSSMAQTTALTIAESSLVLAPIQGAYIAGDAIHPVFSNQGGVDTQAAYSFRLVDASSTVIAEKVATESVVAGSVRSIEIPIPAGAVDGSYNLIASYKDMKTGKEGMAHNLVSISGVKGALQVRTDKQNYLATENIAGLSVFSNSGAALQGGNLHLQVVTGLQPEKTKTWTTQVDFQTGVRKGVDTYGVNDWIIPDDEFEDSVPDPNKWIVENAVSIQSGTAFIDSRVARSSLWSKWKLKGDFDIQVDFTSNNSIGDLGAEFFFGAADYSVVVACNGNGYVSSIRTYQSGSVTESYKRSGSFASSGRLRITRVGNAFATYYWSAGAWLKIDEVTGAKFTSPGGAGLYALRYSGGGTGPSVAFDNFRIESGQVETVNQTVDSVRLLPLSDNFDDAVLNEDRWIVIGPKPAENSGLVRFITTPTAVHQGLILRPPVAGDFSAVSAYKNYSSTPALTPHGRYSLWAGIGTMESFYHGYFYINHISTEASQAGGDFIVSLSNIHDSWQMSPSVQDKSSSGKFRVQREGSTGSTYYWDGSKWINQHSRSSLPSSPTVLSFGSLSEDRLPAVTTDANVFAINRTYASDGTLMLKHDSGTANTQWEKFLFSADVVNGSNIKFRTRTAETESGLGVAVWSSYIASNGSEITSQAGRWIEVEVTLSATNPNITPVLHELSVTYAGQPNQVIWQKDIPFESLPGEMSEATQAIAPLGVTGKLYLQGTLTSSTSQTVDRSEYPFYVERGNVQLVLQCDKKVYRPGDTVAITGEVKNMSSIDATGVAVLVEDKRANGGTLLTKTVDLVAGGTSPFGVTFTAGGEGVYLLRGVASQNSSILVETTDQYEVANPQLSVNLLAPVRVGSEAFNLSVQLTNTGKVHAQARVVIADSSGKAIGDQVVMLAAGESKILQYPCEIQADTTYTATVSGDLNQVLTKVVSYEVLPMASTVTTTIVTDKASYDPNTPVVLTYTAVAGEVMEALSAVVTVTKAQGDAVLSATSALPVLLQGQKVTFKQQWNTGRNAPGTYLVTVLIVNSSGVVVSKSTCNLVIVQPVLPSVLLKGQVVPDKKSLLTGEPVSVSYSATNDGNVDLSGVTLSVVTVGVDEETLSTAVTKQVAMAMGDTVTGEYVIDTVNYAARDYMVVLRTSVNGIEESIASAYFRVEGAPSALALVAPGSGSDVEIFSPILSISNAADPNADKLSYYFEIYGDSGFVTLVGTGVALETTGITSWTVPVPLAENATYFWRARAYDGLLYGPWMAPASFRVNTVNDLPSAPSVSSPMHGSAVASFTPELVVGNSTDPDSADLTYNFDVALDPDFAQVVTFVRGVSGGVATTSWTVPESLQENGTYYWRAQADDWLIEGPWSATARFFVNTANDAPSVPVVTSPVNGSTVASLATELLVANSSDPDSPSIFYFFEADTVPTFDSGNVIRSGSVAQGSGSTSWQLAGLGDNTRYYLRVKASDGAADSAWSAPTSFFANTANDAPTTPVLANPSSGAGVNVFAPLLSVHNASDPDRDALRYQFEIYADQAPTNLVARAEGIAETPLVTGWQVPQSLVENATYYWRSRAFDGTLYGDWMAVASFTVNTANDAPSAPRISSPVEGASVQVSRPALAVANSTDPDSDDLTYQFEIYADGTLASASAAVTEGSSGVTVWTPDTPLADNTIYQWRARANDGDSYGPWTSMATFTVHIPKTSINATVNFDPNTLNKTSKGTWVVVYIELPQGYQPQDIDIASIRLEGIPAESQPYAIGDYDRDGIADLMVKFNRGELINLLNAGDKVPVQINGKVGSVAFEGVDVIRVIK